MPCVNPKEGWLLNGKVLFYKPGKSEGISRWIELPCGVCSVCQANKAREWAIRIEHEAQMHEESSTILLTYSPDNLPPCGSLRYQDVQLFLKRLRKKLAQRKIRYFICGEYGEKTKRPHYHLVIFGWTPPDPVAISEGRRGDTIYSSAFLDSCWKLGFATWQRFVPEAADYVARYVTKKLGDTTEYKGFDPKTGEVRTLSPVFAQMSRRPGLGESWFRRYYRSDVAPRDAVLNRHNKPLKVPAYYDKLVAKLYGQPELDKLKRKRMRDARARVEADPRSVVYARKSTDDIKKARLKNQKESESV